MTEKTALALAAIAIFLLVAYIGLVTDKPWGGLISAGIGTIMLIIGFWSLAKGGQR